MSDQTSAVLICVSYPLLGEGLRRMIEDAGGHVVLNEGCCGCSDGHCRLPEVLSRWSPEVFVLEFGCPGHKYLLKEGIAAAIIAVNMANNETYLYRIQRYNVESGEDLVKLVQKALSIR